MFIAISLRLALLVTRTLFPLAVWLLRVVFPFSAAMSSADLHEAGVRVFFFYAAANVVRRPHHTGGG